MEALNGQFEQADDFFGESVQLLSEYPWIYNCRNTDILTNHILKRIPDNWIPVFQLDALENIQMAIKGDTKPSWPPDLIELVKRCWRLSLIIDGNRKGTVASKWKKVNPKKVHEVAYFSRLIGENCAEKQIRHVVDIGAGLGYVDKELSESWNLHVLGLERDAYRVTAANQRSSAETKENAQHQSRATFKELTLLSSEDILGDQVESVVTNWLEELQCESPPLCMIGLHSCGDLSPVMMELFMNSLRFRTLLLVSCCYHRMEWQNSPVGNNFPLSISLKTASLKSEDDGVPFYQDEGIQQFFRLAAQETPNHWINLNMLHHRLQARHTFYRAVIQLYAAQEGIQLLKKQRRPVKKENISAFFEDYLKQAVEGFGLQGDIVSHQEKLMEVYRSHEHLSPAMETLIVLQTLLQPVAEALILVDRVISLREKGISGASLQQVFDDRISPRCFVLMANKTLITDY